jgi:NAD/NADP transhydrogenase alpha subunit
LSLYEAAVMCKRLSAYGWSSQEITRRLGYASAQYVDGLLALAGAPLAIRKMVMENGIAATTAIGAIKKHGGGRVTTKHMPQAEFKKAVRKLAEPMHTALTKVQADPGFASLSEEVRVGLTELLGSIKQ